jgi:Ion channel
LTAATGVIKHSLSFAGGGRMTQIHRIPIMIPLAVSLLTFACTIFVHVLPLGVTVTIVRREKRLGRAGASFWGDFSIVALIILIALVAHLIEIALWAAVFVICGEFQEFGIAFYHSAVNYTTLGYGDLIMSPKWRLLGPLEAANGILMFGVSTAMIFSLILRLTETRFVDLKD